METTLSLDSIFVVSEDIVSREIEGEVVIVPLTAGIGDLEDDLFTLNETGKSIWKKLDGKKTLRTVIQDLSSEYQASEGEIEKDVRGLLEELHKRKMIVEI